MNDSAPTSGITANGPVPFAKGHGTENDFVIVPDPDGVLEIPAQLVRALCDRRAGIGGDGLLRVVRTTRIPDGLGLEGEWFMDYRNGDGSIAEMCGNGIRVFARYLVEAGLAKAGTMRIATRAGTKLVVVPDGHSDITVDMGPALVGSEAVVQVGGRSFAGISVSMGNPHLVCGTVLPVADIDLSSPPDFDPATFPTGVNVEVVNVLGGDPRTTPGVPAPDGYDLRVRMRVYERGSGETRSCGTGACAVGAVALRSAGKSTGRVAVDVPGGRVAITVTTATTLLEGPAVLVAGGQLSPEWLARVSAPLPAVEQASPEPEGPQALLGEVVSTAPATPPPAAPPAHGAPPANAAPPIERPASERPASERPASERPASERPASERAAEPWHASDRPAASRQASESAADPWQSAERFVVGDRSAASHAPEPWQPPASAAERHASPAERPGADPQLDAWQLSALGVDRPATAPREQPEPPAALPPGWPVAERSAAAPPARSGKAPARSVAPAGPVPGIDPVSPTAPVRSTSPTPTRPTRPIDVRHDTGQLRTLSGEPIVSPGLGALLAAVTAPVVEAIAEESADEQPPSGQHTGQRGQHGPAQYGPGQHTAGHRAGLPAAPAGTAGPAAPAAPAAPARPEPPNPPPAPGAAPGEPATAGRRP